MPIHSHRDLIVWQKAMDLAVEVYRLTSLLPKIETYRLVSQITRAGASVPANIAEGQARFGRKEYAHFLSISKGSLMEVDTFLTLAVRLKYLRQADCEAAFALIAEINKMLTKMRNRLRGERGNRD